MNRIWPLWQHLVLPCLLSVGNCQCNPPSHLYSLSLSCSPVVAWHPCHRIHRQGEIDHVTPGTLLASLCTQSTSSTCCGCLCNGLRKRNRLCSPPPPIPESPPPPFSPSFKDSDFQQIVAFNVDFPTLPSMSAFSSQITWQYMALLAQAADVPAEDVTLAPVDAEAVELEDHDQICRFAVTFYGVTRASAFLGTLEKARGGAITSSAFVSAFGPALVVVDSVAVETVLIGTAAIPASPPSPSLPPFPPLPPPPEPTPAPTPAATTPGPTASLTPAPTPSPTTPSPTLAPLPAEWQLEGLDAQELCRYLTASFFRSDVEETFCTDSGACDDGEPGKLCEVCLQLAGTLEAATGAGLVSA